MICRLGLRAGILLLGVLLVLAPHGSTQTIYFPDEYFRDRAAHVASYSRQLRSMNEPSLLEASQDKKAHAYRFLWLRSFHEPIAIRLVVREDKTGLVVFRRTSRQQGDEAAKVLDDRSTELSRDQVKRFLQIVDRENFWKLPTRVERGMFGLDGSTWIIEGVKDRKYHFVNRWTPEKDPVRNLALELIRLSEFRPYYDEVY